MSTFNIAVLPGDYIGPEVIAEARRVLEAAGRRFGHTFSFKEALAGGAAWDAHGEHLPQSTLDTCSAAEVVTVAPDASWRCSNAWRRLVAGCVESIAWPT